MSGRRILSGGTRTKPGGPILIVDDNADDAALTKRAIVSLYPDLSVRILESGKALVAYLENESAHASAAPQVASAILLDLRMPEMDGFEVLEWLKNHPVHSQIPVIVLSVFDDLQHLKRAYALLARAYLLKPINTDSFRHAVASLNIDC